MSDVSNKTTDSCWEDMGMTTETPFRLEDGGIVFREHEYPPKDPLSGYFKLTHDCKTDALVDALNKAYQQGWAEAHTHYKENP